MPFSKGRESTAQACTYQVLAYWQLGRQLKTALCVACSFTGSVKVKVQHSGNLCYFFYLQPLKKAITRKHPKDALNTA